ncbi:MAG: ATP synthase F1 subunit gamma [Candidatus Moraniibacteriota bacterium]|nr:MAG: ATP synthase F1 subunit gamma [Candidatus Moranbacteria bacterium]
MPGTREIRRRIKSVKNTGKITRAMEMISSVKMRKAVEGVYAMRPYAFHALEVLRALRAAPEIVSTLPLLSERPRKTVLFVVVTSSRGLCGSFNAQIFRRIKSEVVSMTLLSPDVRFEYLSLGKKGDTGLRFLPGDIMASFPEVALSPTSKSVRSVASLLFSGFEDSRWSDVFLVYTDFVSALLQKPRVRRILPFSRVDTEEELGEMGEPLPIETVSSARSEYVIEPSAERVLSTLLFRLTEMQILHALFESKASEEAARMVAMRNATDASKEMTESFTLLYNQLRQAKVTQEIAELSAGMAAVA